MRIARRPADRFVSFFRRVHRYQCIVLECGWRGNLPPSPPSMAAPDGMAPLTTSTGTGRAGL
jgi:hypothetical protein